MIVTVITSLLISLKRQWGSVLFFTGQAACMNMFSLFLAVILSWYFGGFDFRLHPDKIIASLVSYSEKSFYREGSSREGTIALIINLAAVFGVSTLLFNFIRNAGSFWYIIFSTLIIYWAITPRFTRAKPERSTSLNYMNYALPVILYALLLGPVGALLYRVLPINTHMNPVSIDKYKSFGEPVEKTYTVLTDMALLFVPVLRYISDIVRQTVRYLKSFRH